VGLAGGLAREAAAPAFSGVPGVNGGNFPSVFSPLPTLITERLLTSVPTSPPPLPPLTSVPPSPPPLPGTRAAHGTAGGADAWGSKWKHAAWQRGRGGRPAVAKSVHVHVSTASTQTSLKNSRAGGGGVAPPPGAPAAAMAGAGAGAGPVAQPPNTIISRLCFGVFVGARGRGGKRSP